MAGKTKTDVNKLAVTISEMLQAYTDEVGQKIIQAASDIADEAVEKLKSTSPKRPSSGRYAKDWAKKQVQFKRARAVKFTVHNKKHYGLTHLLEYGHATRSGGRTKAQPHIAPVEQWAKEEMVKRVEEAVKGD